METDSRPRVLVVDDEPSVLETIAAILRREGYLVVAVPGLEDALARVREETLDVVLTDLRLEGGTGLTIVAELRRHQPHATAIVLTGYASLQSAIDALREGAYDYLVKPCNVDELKATVARAVERGMLARQLRERIEDLDVANAKLRSFNEELSRQVEQATTELRDKVRELAEAKRRLEEAQYQRDEFISMIAHELGQPLTMIGGYAQLLGRAKVSSDTHERARTALIAQTRRLSRLVKDLADVAHLSTGHFRLYPAECDLVETVHDQIESARATTERHTFRIELPSYPVTAVVDRDRIAQVLSNILTNAVTYTSGGEIRVSLKVEDGSAIIQISDQGPGIPQDRLETIFEPRVRLADTSRDSPKGAGLGLYIARGIIEAHGGRIWAESTEGQGTSFTVALPLSSVS